MNALLQPLARLDAASFDTGLSPENARACWLDALELADQADLARPLTGTAPRAVAIIASANVFTAPLEWAYQLAARGVRVVLKAASRQQGSAAALAALPGVEVRSWLGGDDLEAEARTLAQVDAAVVLGAEPTIRAMKNRAPVPVLGLGPRFGIAWAPKIDASGAALLARDLARYDGRGCMSPTALFTAAPDLAVLAAAMADAERHWPRGEVSAEEAVETRRLTMLARATGGAVEGEGWAVLELPAARFQPATLPRVLVVHRAAAVEEMAAALAPWRAELGTVGTTDTAGVRGVLDAAPGVRLCPPGEMQRPPGSRPLHDGVDVLAWLWSPAW